MPFRELPSLDRPFIPQRFLGSHPRPTFRDTHQKVAENGADFAADYALAPAISNLRGLRRDQSSEINPRADDAREHLGQDHIHLNQPESVAQRRPTSRPSAPRGSPCIADNAKSIFNLQREPEPTEVVNASGCSSQYAYRPQAESGYSGYAIGEGGNGGNRGSKRKGDEDDDKGRDLGGDDKKGGDEGDGEENEPQKKVPKKTPVACNFCRGRKLKCDGVRPSCSNCISRNAACFYVVAPRRRGPGRKTKMMMMKQEQEMLGQSQQPQASTSTVPSSQATLYRGSSLTGIPELPRPPPPTYPYPVGQIPRSSARLEGRPEPMGAGPSGVHTLQPQDVRDAQRSSRSQRRSPEQAYVYGQAEQLYQQQQWQTTPPQHSQQEHPLSRGHAESQVSDYPVQDEYNTSQLVHHRGRVELVNHPHHGEEGMLSSQSRRRAPSPPDDTDANVEGHR